MNTKQHPRNFIKYFSFGISSMDTLVGTVVRYGKGQKLYINAYFEGRLIHGYVDANGKIGETVYISVINDSVFLDEDGNTSVIFFFRLEGVKETDYYNAA